MRAGDYRTRLLTTLFHRRTARIEQPCVEWRKRLVDREEIGVNVANRISQASTK
jgi:hypothetical protein